jgi:hypothetical protein
MRLELEIIGEHQGGGDVRIAQCAVEFERLRFRLLLRQRIGHAECISRQQARQIHENAAVRVPPQELRWTKSSTRGRSHAPRLAPRRFLALRESPCSPARRILFCRPAEKRSLVYRRAASDRGPRTSSRARSVERPGRGTRPTRRQRRSVAAARRSRRGRLSHPDTPGAGPICRPILQPRRQKIWAAVRCRRCRCPAAVFLQPSSAISARVPAGQSDKAIRPPQSNAVVRGPLSEPVVSFIGPSSVASAAGTLVEEVAALQIGYWRNLRVYQRQVRGLLLRNRDVSVAAVGNDEIGT